MATGAPEKSIFRTDQTQGTRIENVTIGFAKRMYGNRVSHFRSLFLECFLVALNAMEKVVKVTRSKVK